VSSIVSAVASALAHRRIKKMNGLGNAILVLDLRGTAIEVSAAEARSIGIAKGLHYDQLMVLHDPVSPGTVAFIRIYNRDGSLAGACGNGTRCVAWALWQNEAFAGTRELVVETAASLLACERLGDTLFSVDMGKPVFAWQKIPLRHAVDDTDAVDLTQDLAALPPINPVVLRAVSVVNMGNPHAVLFVDDIDACDLAFIGPALEYHPLFPDRANISIAQIEHTKVEQPDHIQLKVWERGAGATLACGSAACATLVAAVRRGLAGREARISLPGGDLTIAWRESDDHVIMTGPVTFEFETSLDPALFQAAQ